MTCEHGFDRPHYTLPVNARECDGTPNAVLAYAATLDGTEPLWFCTTHKQSGKKPNKSCVWAQAFGRYGAVNQSKECRMVEGRWFPLPDKETTDEMS